MNVTDVVRRLPRLLLAVLVVLGCAGASAISGAIWAGSAAAQQGETARTQAATVASAVSTALARVDDLASNTGALLASRPDLSPTEWSQWLHAVDVERRYSSVRAFAFARVVPAAELSRFLPRPPGAPDAQPKVFPAGSRPTYCLMTLRYGALMNSWPSNLDVCGWSANPIEKALDSGSITVMSSPIGSTPTVMIVAPIYRGGVTPSTLALRHSLRLGVVGGFFDGDQVLKDAIAGDRQVAVQLLRQDATTQGSTASDQTASVTFGEVRRADSVVASAGAVRGHGLIRRQLSLQADGHWLLHVTSRPLGTAPAVQGAAVAGGSFLVLMLFALLLAVLAMSRRRALQLADRRTGELQRANRALEQQACNDALTGVLNRAGFYAATQRLSHDDTFVLLVDIDDFKSVNDRHGHLAGDALLKQAVARLRRCLRAGSDVVARIGGDEFVVLLGPPTSAGQAESVAARIVDDFHLPFDLDGVIVQVGASVGVARCSAGMSWDQALALADELMYAAKGRGKGAYAVERPQESPTISPSSSMSM